MRPTSGAASSRSLPQEVRGQLSDELIDEFLVGRRTEAEVVGRDGLLGQLTKRLVERAMAGELSARLGYEPPPRAARWDRQHAQRQHPEDDPDPSGPRRTVAAPGASLSFLDGRRLKPLRQNATGSTTVKLKQEAADPLNKTFGITALKGGLKIQRLLRSERVEHESLQGGGSRQSECIRPSSVPYESERPASSSSSARRRRPSCPGPGRSARGAWHPHLNADEDDQRRLGVAAVILDTAGIELGQLESATVQSSSTGARPSASAQPLTP